MVNFNVNNLDVASSPYLQQHKNNPINWQEWNNATLKFAKLNKKLIFVSSGYSTCHWCHVMATEAFSDNRVAEYLNKHFVCIKLDREQRPDIDSFLMSFIQEVQGHGGWPLNVVLSPEGKPFTAATYVPVDGFISWMSQVMDAYGKHKVPDYVPKFPNQKKFNPHEIYDTILSNYDHVNGGFSMPKFPPHNTLLFLLHYYEVDPNSEIRVVIKKTLENIALGGLHDHLQGGFYRYCVDSKWTIPHFEKMLYDQAMMLMVFSSAYKIFKTKWYKQVVERIIKSLDETFENQGLYYSAHDADTDHIEGLTYVWNEEELRKILSSEEYNKLGEVYDIQCNFEGKIHLIKKKVNFLPGIEQKLLQERKKRQQPFIDKKIITAWNSLVGIGLIFTHRYIGSDRALNMARTLLNTLMQKHYMNGKLYRSSLGPNIEKLEFLEDYSALLLLLTYMHEEGENSKELIKELLNSVQKFKKDFWMENKPHDFQEIRANEYDHPSPSSVSLTHMAQFRAKLILGEEYDQGEYKLPLNFDYWNLVTFFKNGNCTIIRSPNKISWEKLPMNSIQIRAAEFSVCHDGRCDTFESEEEILKWKM